VKKISKSTEQVTSGDREDATEESSVTIKQSASIPETQNEYLWKWKVRYCFNFLN